MKKICSHKIYDVAKPQVTISISTIFTQADYT